MFISPAQAGTISKRLGHLLQTGTITHREFALGQVLLWRCRGSGQGVARASYSALARLTHMAKDTVRLGLRKLEELGLIARLKHRVRVQWMGCSIASRQGVNAYRLQPPDTDTGGRPAIREIVIQKEVKGVETKAAPVPGRNAVPDLLARRRRQLEAKWRAGG